ncbi:MAG: ABC transporter permease [Opitutales bacterium]|nr:ABC transporter permease [Opitutales bacterium]
MRPGLYAHLWVKFTWRHWTRAPWQTLTFVAILALGVATFLSIRMATRAAVTNFSGFAEAVSGGSDWMIQGIAGKLPVEVLEELEDLLSDLPVHILPVLESTGTFVHTRDGREESRVLRLLGIDLIGAANLPQRSDETPLIVRAAEINESSIWDLVRDRRAAHVAPAFASRAGLEAGDVFGLFVDDRKEELRVASVLPGMIGRAPVPDALVVMDLPALQMLLGRETEISRVEFLVEAGSRRGAHVETLRERLSADNGNRWVGGPPEDEAAAGERMTAAFRLNLTVLAFIALLVGLYLIAQGMDAAVVRRRREIGILRSLGFTRGMVVRLWFVELVVLAFVGSILGILLGHALAQLSVGAVSQTVNALYRASAAESATLTAADVFIGLVLGLGGGMIAGWLPLRDAAATPPAQVLAKGDFSPGLHLLSRPWLGWLLAGLGGILCLLPALPLEGGGRFPLPAYTAAFLWLTGGTVLAAALISPVACLLMRLPIVQRSAPAKVALSRLRRPNSRHRLAVAGLYVAVGMGAAMTILIASFERTMQDWIAVRFQADVYISTLGQSAGAQNRLRAETIAAIAERPEVRAADPLRFEAIRIGGLETFLAASDLRLLGVEQNLLWHTPLRAAAAIPDDVDTWAIASESFMRRFNQRAGSIVEVPTPSGHKRVYIRGIQADYGNERGSLLIDRTVFSMWWGDADATNLSLFLHDSTDRDAFLRDLRAAFPALAIRDNRELGTVILSTFRQTFAVTHALQLIALGVALAGLVLALVTLLREGGGYLATLRSLGFRRADIAQCTLWEGLVLALTGLCAGLILSFALGTLLIYGINRPSFGWTLQFAIPLTPLALFALLLLATAALAARLTGNWGARLAT